MPDECTCIRDPKCSRHGDEAEGCSWCGREATDALVFEGNTRVLLCNECITFLGFSGQWVNEAQDRAMEIIMKEGAA